jgi:hypothetical protein
MNSQTKIVVFDLDETLGHFEELGVFWNGLNSYIKTKKIPPDTDQISFDKLLDLYPEFLRPNIMIILNYLKKKKMDKECDKIVIYTNNQGPREWCVMIKTYFENKLKYKLFDQIIGAFKINGKQIELCRTSNSKKHKDLIKCVKLPENTQICYIDDVNYPEMKNPNVYYINIKPYVYSLPFELMIDRFINSPMMTENLGDPTQMKEYFSKYLKSNDYKYVEKSKKELNIDKIITKKILQHLHLFFSKNSSSSGNKTRHNKKYENLKNKTIKKR